MRHRQLSDTMIVIELLIDVKEAMGANITNTVLEGVSPYIQSLVEGSRVGVRILSNLCTERMARAEYQIPLKNLAWKKSSGREVAEGIINAYDFARADVY